MACEVRSLVSLPIRPTVVVRLIHQGLHRLGYDAKKIEVSVAFVGDARMKELNGRYRGIPQTTDVLSFAGTGNHLGELIISVPQARRQAREFGTTVAKEIQLLVVHGLLHLVGYDHERPKDRVVMQRLEQKLLKGPSLIHRAHTSA